MTLLVQYTLIYAAVLTLVALGGMFSERSGVINIGLEGIMVFGAMGGAMTMVLLPATTPPGLIVILTLIVAALVGMVSSLLLAVACINFKADQTLAGTALNMLATATATVLIKAFNTKRSNGSNFSAILDYIDARRGFIFKIGKLELSWFIVIAIILLIVSWVVLYKTKFGLRLRSCGEHPQAADSVGINVYKMRYAGVIISGALGGLGGLIYIAAANSTSKPRSVITTRILLRLLRFLLPAAARSISSLVISPLVISVLSSNFICISSCILLVIPILYEKSALWKR